MSFRWEHFLTLAEELARDKQDEARLRSAISRAYYAVFGLSRDYLRAHDYKISRQGRAHREIQDAFYSSGDPIWRRVGLEVERLRDQRLLADYEELVMNLDSMADQSVVRAQRILRWLGCL